jgi:hypothetical protein
MNKLTAFLLWIERVLCSIDGSPTIFNDRYRT